MPIARLRITNSPLSGAEFGLPDHPVIVGRSSENDIVIPDQSVSRQHVRVEVQNGHCVLTDLGSHNGIVIGGRTVREAAIPSGGQFELGDVTVEFLVAPAEVAEATAPPGALAPAAVPEPSYAPAYPGAVPSERPVYVDDVFGLAAEPVEEGPGDEEKAAVAGARSVAKYLGVVVLILGAGAVMWHLAGGRRASANVKGYIVRAGEIKVIDLGRDSVTGRIDNREIYDHSEYVDADGEEIASFELDSTHFLATIEGHTFGSTDVLLTGSGGQRATVRILVRGATARPAEEDLSPEDRLRTARALVRGAKRSRTGGHLHRAMLKFRQAVEILEPVRGEEAAVLRRNADALYIEARDELDEEYERIKFQAVVRYHDRDRVGALKELDRLRALLSERTDRSDVRRQKIDQLFKRFAEQVH